MNAKPLAALTSGLLARKGGAKPAMRPQVFGGFGRPEDLGWNDMGPEVTQPQPEPPAVVQQQREIAERLSRTDSAPRTVARIKGAKSAFTLRLDEERHLRLRLASAVRHRSSQQLVTEALDAMLAQMPDLDALVAQARNSPARKK